jgi:hypothetical protein
MGRRSRLLLGVGALALVGLTSSGCVYHGHWGFGHHRGHHRGHFRHHGGHHGHFHGRVHYGGHRGHHGRGHRGHYGRHSSVYIEGDSGAAAAAVGGLVVASWLAKASSSCY